MKRKRKVVVIGGGNGTAKSVVALKKYISELELSAVVSMSDSGGSSGRLREKFGILPPGDILCSILAMSRYDYDVLKPVLKKNRPSSGHSLGNIILKELAGPKKDMVNAVREFEKVVEAVGHCYPSTIENTTLVAELDDGDVVKGEAEIDQPSYDRSKRIKKARLEPEAEVYPETAKVIEGADIIVIAGGSLYTSLIAAILPKGISEVIKKSQAKVISVVSKFYEAEGETGPQSVHEYLGELEMYIKRDIDYVLYNDSDLSDEKMQENKEQGWALYELDEEKIVSPPSPGDGEGQREGSKRKFIKADLERDQGFAIDPNKLGKELMKIIK